VICERIVIPSAMKIWEVASSSFDDATVVRGH
jgi:hypothetical protein